MLFFWLPLLLLSGTSGREVGYDGPISKAGQDWLNSLFRLPGAPRVRREYRTLSEEERLQYHRASQLLRNDTSVEPNKYDLLVSLHARRSTRNSAHRGPGFVGWHRVFLLLIENALREKVPGLTLPYWDTTLEAEMDEPHHSCLWAEEFQGGGDGFVKDGPFANWPTQDGQLYRTVGIRNWPMSDHNLSTMFQMSHLVNISYPNTDDSVENTTNYEKLHNNVHRWVGGDMALIETAADDPIFFVYHAFVDLVWEEFRSQQRARGVDPTKDYAEKYGQSRHHMYAPLGLGNLLAIDGQSDVFARNIVYAPRPSCSRLAPACNSTYLWCDIRKEKCMPWTQDELRELKLVALSNRLSLRDQSIVYKKERYETDLVELQNGLLRANEGPLGRNKNGKKLFVEEPVRVTNAGQSTNTNVGSRTEQELTINIGLGEDETLVSLGMVVLVACVVVLAALSVCSRVLAHIGARPAVKETGNGDQKQGDGVCSRASRPQEAQQNGVGNQGKMAVAGNGKQGQPVNIYVQNLHELHHNGALQGDTGNIPTLGCQVGAGRAGSKDCSWDPPDRPGTDGNPVTTHTPDEKDSSKTEASPAGLGPLHIYLSDDDYVSSLFDSVRL